MAQRRGTPIGPINPFVVFSDLTISVILCLTVALGMMACSPNGLREKLAQARAEARYWKKKFHDTQNCVPLTIVDKQVKIRTRLSELESKGVQVAETFDSQVVRFGENVLFDQGQSSLKPAGQEMLGQFAQRLNPLIEEFRDQPGHLVEIQIQGHTDGTGAHDLNFDLSISRAKQVYAYLSGRLPRQYLSVAGYAWHRPVKRESAKVAVDANRRIDIRLIFQRPDAKPAPTIEPLDFAD